MSVLDRPVVFVDVETNGLSPVRGRVIEVAALRIENNRLTTSFNQLIDPETDIPPFISRLTSITEDDVRSAPTFSTIADELFEVIDGAILIAHNARFDYSFLKQEFKRVGRKFNPKLLCTVRLSRALYPDLRGHKLQDIIDRCGIKTENRHRAYDDAYALWKFLIHAYDNLDSSIIDSAVMKQLRTPSIPKAVPPQLVASLPDAPGVYTFEDIDGSPLYIGKSVNIRKRVLSHFTHDHDTETEFRISQQIAHIDYKVTDGELEALLLESRLIKERQPLHNRMLRRNQKMTLARQTIDEAGYIRISIADVATINPKDTSDILAVYTTKGKARRYLDQAVRDYLLCPKLLGFENGSGSCFLYQLKKCAGACVGKEPSERYNARLLGYFDGKKIEQWPFKTAIAINEKSEAESKSIIVDHWCVIADVSSDEECSPVIRYYEKSFDLDTYNILRSYLRDKMDRLKIQTVSLERLSRLDGIVEV